MGAVDRRPPVVGHVPYDELAAGSDRSRWARSDPSQRAADHPSRGSGKRRLGTVGARRRYSGMGMNPFRQHRRSPADYVMVAAAFVVIALLVAWAALG